VIGKQVFITYAVQDATKHNPILGSGNGIVSIFDFDGNFVQRFATGGFERSLGNHKAGRFGPFSNDILIGKRRRRKNPCV
jgi:hypothetical protein